ncbi:MAG: SDR family oxidoreductase [Candidatus Dormibacteraeota bacterium]|nr:SDR family oxidoreductase [Candidatus Dormibacteraeota bacterium]
MVTGVGRRRGIGAAICQALLRDRWAVSACGWRPYDVEAPWFDSAADDVDTLVREFEASGRFHWQSLDLTPPEAGGGLFEELDGANSPAAALVLAHAMSLSGGLLEVTADDFDRHMQVNARSTLLLIQQFARRCDQAGIPGAIVTFVSHPPLSGEIAYAASKGAIEWLTLSAAAGLAPGITVNAIDPGPTDTGWMGPDVHARIAEASPLRRPTRSEDVADVVAFLCSERGHGITGQVIHCDGGWSSLRG